MKKQEEYLNATDAAKHCGISRPTFHRWREQGLIPAPAMTNGNKIVRWNVADLPLQKRGPQ